MRRASLISIIRVIAGVYLVSLAVKLLQGVISPVIDAQDPVKAAEQLANYEKYKGVMIAAGILFAVVGVIVAIAGVYSTIRTFKAAANAENAEALEAQEEAEEDEEETTPAIAPQEMQGVGIAARAALMARNFGGDDDEDDDEENEEEAPQETEETEE